MKQSNGNDCNNKQRWNDDKCRCECKEVIGKSVCDKVFIWNPSNCDCECDKACDVGEYLDYKNWKCRKQLVHKVVEECTENVKEVELAKIASAEDKNKHKMQLLNTVHCVIFNNFYS